MQRVGWATVLCLLAVGGCELISSVDRSKILNGENAATGGSAGATSSGGSGGVIETGGGGSTGGSSTGGSATGGSGGATPALNCDNVADGTFVAKFQIEGTKPAGEDYLAADGFQAGDQPSSWPRKYLGSDPSEMLAEINFGLVGPTWYVYLSWGLTSNPDPNKPGKAVDFWTCQAPRPDWGCGVDLTYAYLGCYGHTVVPPTGDAVVGYTIP